MVKYLVFSLLLFCSNSFANDSCPHKRNDSSSLLEDVILSFAETFQPLVYLNNGEIESARRELIKQVSANVYVIDLFISEPRCKFPEHEIILAKKYLKMVSKMYEIYPVPEWENSEIALILEKAKSFENATDEN
ncbi:hypothetical protein CWB98_22065 [Pseudoalteromonas rubra]|uniref:Uncharacterized protein n=1 Tax=Pseudoalteromonas rubra TaxID=43658 RepID=A0A5S3WQU7_9GAMM|nr:hypothetical protein CWB98_22065 [Pseudoalteromonas rubra]